MFFLIKVLTPNAACDIFPKQNKALVKKAGVDLFFCHSAIRNETAAGEVMLFGRRVAQSVFIELPPCAYHFSCTAKSLQRLLRH